MMRVSDIKKQGFSLKTFNVLMFLVALVVSVVMFIVMHRTTTLYEMTSTITQDVVELRESAFELQVASDYLTEQMRSFALTGNKKYLANYFEEANVTRRRDKALEKIEDYGGGTSAYTNLKDAMLSSLELMETEYYAALLTMEAYGIDPSEFPDIPGNIELSEHDKQLSRAEQIECAENILFDDAYRLKKESITNSMRKCLEEISEESGEKQSLLAKQLSSQVFLEHVLTAVFLIIMLGIVMMTSLMVINPMMKFVELIREQKLLPVKGSYELRFLAKNYNLIYYTNLRNREKLAFEASHDQLTGLYNRRGYEFLMSNIDIESSALMLIDLDNFKQINDHEGHDVGDRVLIRVADTLKKDFRDNDYVCRIGGDEFAVILTHVDKGVSERIIKRVKKINEMLSKPGKGVPGITVSVGVAFGASRLDADSFLKETDLALYEVKENGKHDVAFYDDRYAGI